MGGLDGVDGGGVCVCVCVGGGGILAGRCFAHLASGQHLGGPLSFSPPGPRPFAFCGDGVSNSCLGFGVFIFYFVLGGEGGLLGLLVLFRPFVLLVFLVFYLLVGQKSGRVSEDGIKSFTRLEIPRGFAMARISCRETALRAVCRRRGGPSRE